MGLEDVMKYVVEKHKEALLSVESLGFEALAWLDGVFPPETRGEKINRWSQIARPYLIATMVLTLIVFFCHCCCCRSRGGGKVKMMKAPGRNHRMPRREFESDPKIYFRKLRSRSR